MRKLKVAAAVAMVLSSTLGGAAFVLGRLVGHPGLEEAGAWMTLPLWLVLGGLALVAAIGLPAAAFARAAAAVRGRMQR